MEQTDITIIGAGVVGLAIAAELSQFTQNIVVLDRNESYGRETSSRNSEVLHSGIYYPTGTLKAKLCVQGIEKLYHLCQLNDIHYKRVGKIIVAIEENEISQLHTLNALGNANGVENLHLIDAKEIKRLEQNALGVYGLYSPNSGIIDSYGLMTFFYNSAKSRNVIFAFNSEVSQIDLQAGDYTIRLLQDDYLFSSRIVINCTGLSSGKTASLCGIDIKKAGYTIHLCKGSYFSCRRKVPISKLIYPVPESQLEGLGIHATIDLSSRLRFGPDTEYVDTIDYSVDPRKLHSIYDCAKKIIQDIKMEDLAPDQSGIRPKLQARGESFRDFIIEEESTKGLRGLVNLVGIESPGLTACKSIAEYVVTLISHLIERPVYPSFEIPTKHEN